MSVTLKYEYYRVTKDKLYGKPAITLGRGKEREIILQGYEGSIWEYGPGKAAALLTGVAARRLNNEKLNGFAGSETVIHFDPVDLPKVLKAIGYINRRKKQKLLADNWSYR